MNYWVSGILPSSVTACDKSSRKSLYPQDKRPDLVAQTLAGYYIKAVILSFLLRFVEINRPFPIRTQRGNPFPILFRHLASDS